MISKFAEGFLEGLLKAAAGIPEGAKEVEVEYEGKPRKPSPETLARVIGSSKGAKHSPVRGALIRARKWLDLKGRRKKFSDIRARVVGQLQQAKMDAADRRDAMVAAKLGRPFKQPISESQVALPAVVHKIRQGYRPADKPIPFASMGASKVRRLEERLKRLGQLGVEKTKRIPLRQPDKREPVADKLDRAMAHRFFGGRALLYGGAAALPIVGGAALYAALRRKKRKKGR